MSLLRIWEGFVSSVQAQMFPLACFNEGYVYDRLPLINFLNLKPTYLPMKNSLDNAFNFDFIVKGTPKEMKIQS